MALVTAAGTLAVGWLGLRGVMRKAQQEEAATNTTARLELERLLMARIDQLQQHIAALEARVAAKDARIGELEKRVDELETELAKHRAERDWWRGEAERLKARLEDLCNERGGATG